LCNYEFHRQLPDHQPTRLVSLPQAANDLGLKAVYLKEEGGRLGLPSFKILGASWGTYMALAKVLGLAPTTGLDQLQAALRARDWRPALYAATDGNHGRAVARRGAILDLPVQIFVPSGLQSAAIQAIQREGQSVQVCEISGSYDEAVHTAFMASQQSPGVFIQDTASEEYEEVASVSHLRQEASQRRVDALCQWVVQGYSTMMREIDEQLRNSPTLVVAPVGVGSLAQSVVSHYKAPGKARTAILTVEPDTAACLHTSLWNGECAPIRTTDTIMTGLNCGTVSSIAWPILQAGVDASLTVNDFEVHDACQALESEGIDAGPCGAAPLAALYRLSYGDREEMGLDRTSTVVLLCTESKRDYDIPGTEPDTVR